MKFWIYLNVELSELLPKFERVFGVNNLYRDYENVWEWLESRDRTSKFHLNIARPHDDWEKGSYDKPIIIQVESNAEGELNEDEIAINLKSEFKCTVFTGEITVGSNDEPVIGWFKEY